MKAKSAPIAGARSLVVLAVIVCTLAAQVPKPLPEVKVVDSIPVTAVLQGLGMAKGQLWAIDSKRAALTRIGTADKKILGSVSSPITKPRALAWDGKTLWCGGEDAAKVYQVEPAEGKVLRTIKVTTLPTSSPISIEAMAWDGKYLWIAYAAGWSSSLVRVDVSNGRVVQSLFADGIPRGLATDGKSLWMATYNGGKAPSLLAHWTILEDATKMSLTRTFVARLPGKEPLGLSFDGEAFWYADREIKAIRKVMLPSEH